MICRRFAVPATVLLTWKGRDGPGAAGVVVVMLARLRGVLGCLVKIPAIGLMMPPTAFSHAWAGDRVGYVVLRY